MLEDFGDSSGEQEPARSWLRRHRVALILLSVIAVLLGAVAGYAVYLNAKLGDIPQFQMDEELERPGRPAPRGEGFTMLLVGVDNPDASGIEDAIENEQWVPGVYRSDAMLVVHVDSDGRDAQVISVPRDSYVRSPGTARPS